MELSIIVPAYNVEKYIAECLDSILKIQNIKYEIIVVDDGSKDNTKTIVEEYIKRYNNISLVSQVNSGAASARNNGIRKARGEYISFIDSDDYIISEKFEEFFKKVKNKKLDIGFGNYLRYYHLEEKLEIIKEKKKNKYKFLEQREIETGEKFFEYADINNVYNPIVCSCIYNLKFLKENNLFFYEGIVYEDILFSYLSISKARRVKYFNEYFYIYRQRENSVMHSENNELKKESHYKIINILLEELVETRSKRLKRVPVALYFYCTKKYKVRYLDLEKGFFKLKGIYFYIIRKKIKCSFNLKLKYKK